MGRELKFPKLDPDPLLARPSHGFVDIPAGFTPEGESGVAAV
jgi:hypothetical protein